MSKTSRWTTCIVIVLAVSLLSLAATGFTDDIYREQSDAGKMFHKLGRGLLNVLTGWLEVPKNIADTWRKTDPFTGMVIGGVTGIGWTWARTCTGLYDVITFPFPVPQDYVSLIEPESVVTQIWGEPFPHYAESE
jgi:putative exosortase-associated protein (TIGR04073 family)